MADTSGPLYSSQVKCPVCEAPSAHTNVRPGAYTISSKDTDYGPVGLVWSNPAYQKYDPLLFFLATCSHCFYTVEYNAEFRGWEKDLPFLTYRRVKLAARHKAALEDKNGLMRFLGSRIDVEAYPTESAIIKFLLGITEERIAERPSLLNIGRYFLRIAWLFRGQATQAGEPGGAASGLLAKMRHDASKVGSSLRDYDVQLALLQKTLDSLASAMKPGADADLFTRQQAEMTKTLAGARPVLDQLAATVTAVCDAAEKALVGAVAVASGDNALADFRQFLTKARSLWSEVPTSETEALASAVEYYKKAYETGSQVGDGLPQVQTAYLIAELARRAGEFKTATEYFATTIKSGWELSRGGRGDSATVNQINKLLTMANEQARVCKEQEARSTH